MSTFEGMKERAEALGDPVLAAIARANVGLGELCEALVIAVSELERRVDELEGRDR